MTSRLHLLLAATCALALVQLASGQSTNPQCVAAHWGHPDTTENFGAVTIPAGLRIYRAKLPVKAGCRVIGVHAIVCDTNRPRSVRIRNKDAIVIRGGAIRGTGVVYFTARCEPSPTPKSTNWGESYGQEPWRRTADESDEGELNNDDPECQ
ncbi:uncharacterized protein LOC142985186 [Anticarsia gemmatalis]|uniref:uncharacterized protein LOC142985186 n=1 Tax=Anticarsia gemmatalis TaxID=129554 RepID=UPI003F75B733